MKKKAREKTIRKVAEFLVNATFGETMRFIEQMNLMDPLDLTGVPYIDAAGKPAYAKTDAIEKAIKVAKSKSIKHPFLRQKDWGKVGKKLNEMCDNIIREFDEHTDRLIENLKHHEACHKVAGHKHRETYAEHQERVQKYWDDKDNPKPVKEIMNEASIKWASERFDSFVSARALHIINDEEFVTKVGRLIRTLARH
jgi:tRNA U54 and U55 pseudouridine synthase Pus10